METSDEPIRSEEASEWGDRRSGPEESVITPEKRSLQLAFRSLEHIPRRARSYGRAVAVRLFSRTGVRFKTHFGVLVSPITDHTFMRPVFEEPFESALIARLIQPGSTFVDVGANRGWFTLLAAARVGADGLVLAFEPDPAARELLLPNLAANAELSERVRVFECAVGESDGLADFVSSRESALSHLKRSDDVGGSTRQVQLRSLCSLLEEAGGPPVSVIKVDVEGAELGVLEGMGGCRDRIDDAALLVEVEVEHLARFDTTIEDVVNLMSPTHQPYWVCWKHGRLESLPGTRCADSGRNLLALPKERSAELAQQLVTD